MFALFSSGFTCCCCFEKQRSYELQPKALLSLLKPSFHESQKFECFVVTYLLFFFCYFWRATSLGPKPSLFFLVCFSFCYFVFFLFSSKNRKNCFPHKSGLVCFLSVSPGFSLAFFHPLLTLSLSLLSLCPSLFSFLSFFLV